ncbi:MAG: TlpA disulfide reductase family protein [Legionella sp.]
MNKKRTENSLYLIVIALILLVVCIFYTFNGKSARAKVILHELNGQDMPFSSLVGKWVFINYWASWCKPCLDEITELNDFYRLNKDKNVALFAVNYEHLTLSKQKQLITQLNINYPNLKKDPAKELNIEEVNSVPVTIVFNPQGLFVKTLYGRQTASSLNKVMVNPN